MSTINVIEKNVKMENRSVAEESRVKKTFDMIDEVLSNDFKKIVSLFSWLGVGPSSVLSIFRAAMR